MGYDAQHQRTMMSMISGQFVAQAARALAELRVPELLHRGPKPAAEVADQAGANPEAMLRLLRCAVHFELASYDEETARFAATPLLDRLRADAPDSLRSLAITWSSPGHWRQWERLTDAVRHGTEQSAAAHGKPIWEYFAEAPAEADLFSAGMAELSAGVIREAVTAIDARPGDRIADIGGATGSFVLAMLDAHPGTTGVVHDLPHLLESARADIAGRGLADRCAAESGDFFTSVPEADLHLLKFILHDWDDESCAAILRACRRALRPGGRVVVVELVLGPPSKPGPAALMDLNMLAMAPGRERDLAGFDRLFAAAGLRRSATTELSGSHCAIEAVVA
ncbi:methyltransferase [Saccharopolyspora sp. MS10]|uniref:methyltransferase n=1 Tax=Saccharopolyspora sp. MS10 TaxID=3385973 RepID=UPI0039A3C488